MKIKYETYFVSKMLNESMSRVNLLCCEFVGIECSHR